MYDRDKKQFEHQLFFFSKAGLSYTLPMLLGVTILLGFLSLSNPLKYLVEFGLFLIMVCSDIFLFIIICSKKWNKYE